MGEGAGDVDAAPSPRRYAALGGRLRALRHERGLGQGGLARLAGTTATALNQCEAGRTRPRRATLARLAEALGADADELAELAGYGPGVPGDG